MTFKIGMTGVHTVTVGPEHTAHAVGNPGVQVLATPTLTLFCEIAGHNAVSPAYQDGDTSVGFHNDIYHLAATPVGGVVTVRATLEAIEGNRLTLVVEGHDENRKIVRGVHERYVVRLDEFLANVRGGHDGS